jgi:ketosteroid isomerase-like protein
VLSSDGRLGVGPPLVPEAWECSIAAQGRGRFIAREGHARATIRRWCEGVEHVLSGFDAFNARDVDAFVEHFSPDVEWHFNPIFPGNEGRLLRGRMGLRSYMANDIEAIWRSFRAEPEEIYECGDRLLVAVRVASVGIASGVRTDMTIYDLMRYGDDGLVVRRDSYVDRATALEAVDRVYAAPPTLAWRSAARRAVPR